LVNVIESILPQNSDEDTENISSPSDGYCENYTKDEAKLGLFFI